MGWCFDMSLAPRGQMKVVAGPKGPREIHVPTRIIAAGTGDTVTVSYWIPGKDGGGRWCMFTDASPPIAWQPWPDHPHSTGDECSAGGAS